MHKSVGEHLFDVAVGSMWGKESLKKERDKLIQNPKKIQGWPDGDDKRQGKATAKSSGADGDGDKAQGKAVAKSSGAGSGDKAKAKAKAKSSGAKQVMALKAKAKAKSSGDADSARNFFLVKDSEGEKEDKDEDLDVDDDENALDDKGDLDETWMDLVHDEDPA